MDGESVRLDFDTSHLAVGTAYTMRRSGGLRAMFSSLSEAVEVASCHPESFQLSSFPLERPTCRQILLPLPQHKRLTCKGQTARSASTPVSFSCLDSALRP